MIGNTQPDGSGTPVYVVLSADGKININELSAVAEAWVPRMETATDTTNTVDIIVPAGQKWLLQALLVNYQAVTTVGNRRIEMRILDDSGTPIVVHRNHVAVNQALGTTYDYSFAPGFPAAPTATTANNYVQCHLAPIEVPAGWTIRVFDTSNIDAVNDIITIYLTIKAQNMSF